MSDSLAGYTKLMLLIEEDDIDGISELLAKGTDLNAQNKSGQTALTIASKNGSTAIVAKLLGHGANINIRNKFGQTALFTACSQNFEDIVNLLIDHRADVNIKDSRGWTPLMISCYHAHIHIVKILLDHGADIVAEDSFGKTAIARTKSPEIQQLLNYYANKELESYSAIHPEIQQQQSQKRTEERNRVLSLQSPVSQNQSSLVRSSKGSLAPGSDVNLQRSPRARDSSKTNKSPLEKINKETHPYSYKNMKKMLDDPRRADQNVQPTPSFQVQETSLKKKEEQRPKEHKPQQKRGSSSHRSHIENPSPRPEDRYRLKSPETKDKSSLQKTIISNIQSPSMNNPDLSNTKKTIKSPTNDLAPQRPPLKENNLPIEHAVPEDPKKNQQSSHGSQRKAQVSNKSRVGSEQPEQASYLKSKAQQQQQKELKNEVPAAEVKALLSNYIGSYSELIQNYLRQKLSYALAFQVRRIFSSVKQQFTASLLQNTLTLQKDLMESLVSVAERTNSGFLSRNLEELNNDITSTIEAFESQMVPVAEDQELLEKLFQRSQDIDSLLVREADGRYTRETEASRDDFERDIFKFLKLEMNLQVGNAANSINEILYQEFGGGDEALKSLVQESLEGVLGQVSLSLKKNLVVASPVYNESDESQLSNQNGDEQQEENFNYDHQQQAHHHIQHVGFVFTDGATLQPLDANKQNLRETEELPHERKCKETKDGTLANPKIQKDIESITTQFTEKQLVNASGSKKTPGNQNKSAASRSNTKETASHQGQNKLQTSEFSPKNKPAIIEQEKENIEVIEDHASIEQVAKSIDSVQSKQLEKKTEFDPRKFHNLYSNYLVNDQVPEEEALSYRQLERQQAQDQCFERNRVETQKEVKETQDHRYKPEEVISVYRRNEKILIETSEPEIEERSIKETPTELKRIEESKVQTEGDSCVLTATEGSIDASLECLLNKSKEKSNTHPMFILETTKPENFPQNTVAEEIEKPYELTVKGEEQKEEEKINYLIQKIEHDDVISEIGRDPQQAEPSGSTTPFGSDTQLMRDSHTHEPQSSGNLLPEAISALIESKLGSNIQTKKDLVRTPELPKPTSNLIKNKKIMKDFGFTKIVTTTAEPDGQNQSMKTDYFTCTNMTQSMAFESNPLQKSFGVSRIDQMHFSCHQPNPDTSRISLHSDASRKVLTNSLIVENQKLSQDVNSAIQRSKRIHMEYLAAKEQELKNSRFEENYTSNRIFSLGL